MILEATLITIEVILVLAGLFYFITHCYNVTPASGGGGPTDTTVDFESADWADVFTTQTAPNNTAADKSASITRTSDQKYEGTYGGQVTDGHLYWAWDFGALPSSMSLAFRQNSASGRPGLCYGANEVSYDIEGGVLVYLRQSSGDFNIGYLNSAGGFASHSNTTISLTNDNWYYITVDFSLSGDTLTATAKVFDSTDTQVGSSITHDYDVTTDGDASGTLAMSNDVAFYEYYENNDNYIDMFEVNA